MPTTTKTVFLCSATGATLAQFPLPSSDVPGLRSRHTTARASRNADIYEVPVAAGAMQKFVDLVAVAMLCVQ